MEMARLLIKSNNGGSDIQSFSNANHNPIEDHGQVHLRGQGTRNILQCLALPVLDLYTTAHLGALNSRRQHTCNSADQALQGFIGICITNSTTEFKCPKHPVADNQRSDECCMQVRITA